MDNAINTPMRGTNARPQFVVQGTRPAAGPYDPWTVRQSHADERLITGAYAYSIQTSLGPAAPNGTTVFSFRNAGPLFIGVTRVTLTGIVVTALTAAQAVGFDLIIARQWRTQDTGGIAVTPTGDQAKKRTIYPSSTLNDFRGVFTAIVPGVRTLDPQPFSSTNSIGTAALSTLFQSVEMVRNEISAPLVFSKFEGFVIQSNALMPASGQINLVVSVEWFEATTWS